MKLACPLDPTHGEFRTAWHLAAHLVETHRVSAAEVIAEVLPPLDAELARLDADRTERSGKSPTDKEAARRERDAARTPGHYWSCVTCSSGWSGPFPTSAKAAERAEGHRAKHLGTSHDLRYDRVGGDP